ncbi:5'/3'-nucleotidase SurE [Fodinisporobacter ferrooxydans]|uniref:5'-nucleotidase SurE n=1 Tax=Fodinisporobacter ferrooxydans TaxID=2901836 RepID=A0ABY4CHB0_9BACL|nr:5'/3'-nucleotidase SurE [Alicyclobacillaceae bacterium MYW30-H2]
MRILLTNDDGIYAKGIEVLAEHLCKHTEHQVTVVAPDRQKSATGHAITLHKPLHVHEVDLGLPVTAFKINGTPADCVKMGMHVLLDEQPDIVISGVNAGSNLGMDVFYSGTVSAAVEAAMNGIPAVAVSACGYKNFAFAAAAQFVERMIPMIQSQPFEKNRILNINVPPANAPIQGVRVTTLGERSFSTNYEKRLDPLGRSYYWLIGEEITTQNDPESDVSAVQSGWISITPLRLTLTDEAWMKQLKQWTFQ